MSGPTEWGDDRRYPPSAGREQRRTSRLAQVLLAFGAMVLLAGGGIALTIVVARWASGPYPIAIFQRPLIEIVVQGVPERAASPTAAATATATPSPPPAQQASPVPSPSIADATPAEMPTVAPTEDR